MPFDAENFVVTETPAPPKDPLAEFITDPVAREQVRRVLTEARGLIAQGWTQGARRRPRYVYTWSEGQLWWKKTHTVEEVAPEDDMGRPFGVPHTAARVCVGSSYCVLGAIDAASSFGVAAQVLAENALSRKINKKPSGGGIASWNDASGRTKDQVLAVFDELIGG